MNMIDGPFCPTSILTDFIASLIESETKSPASKKIVSSLAQTVQLSGKPFKQVGLCDALATAFPQMSALWCPASGYIQTRLPQMVPMDRCQIKDNGSGTSK